MRTILGSILLVIVLTGCGYHAVGWNRDAGAAQTVNIPIFANRTFKPNVETVLANSLIDEFNRRRSPRVEQSATADVTLSGEVVSYEAVAVSYSGADTVREYMAIIKIAAVLRKSVTNQVLWKGEFTRQQAFPANNDIALQQNAEAAAIDEICGKLAQQLYLRVAEDF